MSCFVSRSTVLMFTLLAANLGLTPALAQQPTPPPATSTTTVAIPGVVAAGVTVEVIKEGFQSTEGPIALPDGSVLFTETAANRIIRIDRKDVVTTFLENSNGSNGLGWDPQGRLVSVQTVPGRTKVGVVYPPSKAVTLAEGFPGRPNDLVVSTKGDVYFTVPGPSVAPGAPAPAPGSFTPALYYIPAGGTLQKVAEGIEFPNGIQLSRDEKTLFVNNTQGEYLLAFDLQKDGTLTNRRNFAKYEQVTRTPAGGFASGADGLAIDSKGRLYAATSAGVQVFSEKGEHLGTIPVSRSPQNIAFAGAGKRTLYIVGRGAAYRVALEAEGFKGRAK